MEHPGLRFPTHALECDRKLGEWEGLLAASMCVYTKYTVRICPVAIGDKEFLKGNWADCCRKDGAFCPSSAPGMETKKAARWGKSSPPYPEHQAVAEAADNTIIPLPASSRLVIFVGDQIYIQHDCVFHRGSVLGVVRIRKNVFLHQENPTH